jgi:hypothetical protein
MEEVIGSIPIRSTNYSITYGFAKILEDPDADRSEPRV